MKIGVVHFGNFTEGVNEIIRSLVKDLNQDTLLCGIEWNRTNNSIDLKELHLNTIEQNKFHGEVILKSFPVRNWLESECQELQDLEAVIIFGGKDQGNPHIASKALHIPISIFNDLTDSDYSLGYDTALNSLCNDIEKIRDTVGSLIYDKLRVFVVQVPGKKLTPLVQDTGVVVDSPVIEHSDLKGIDTVKQAILEKQKQNEHYLFLIMDYSVDHLQLEKKIIKEYEVDWKVVSIDESQCVGPFPTALDRLYTKKTIHSIFSWLDSGVQPGQLVIKNNQVIYQK